MPLGKDLAGRERELADITAALRRGTRAGAVLFGDAGVGKTRLLAELLATVEARREPVLFLRCSPSTADVPLGMLAAVLSAEVYNSGLQPMLMAARDQLIELGNGKRLVVGVDDIHLVDDASAQVLINLIDAGAITFVATYRRGEYLPGAVTELWHRGVLDQIEIRPLDAPACAQMAAGLADGSLDDESAERVFGLTGGNPLHVSVLLRAAHSAGMLVPRADGRVRLTGDLATAPALVEFVESEIRRLDTRLSRALAVVALAEPIGVAEVEALADLEAVAELEDRGFVVISQEGRRSVVRVGHPLFGEILRSRTSRARARLIYRELAQLLEKHGARRREDTLRVAMWALEGGLELSIDRLNSAAVMADLAHDYELAERLARTSFDKEPNFAAGQVLFDVYFHWGRLEEARHVAEALRPRLQTDHERMVILLTTTTHAFWKGADWHAHERLGAAIETFEDQACRDEVTAVRASMLASMGRFAEAIELARPLMHAPSPGTFIYSHIALGSSLRSVNRSPEAVDIIDTGYAAARAMVPTLNVVAVSVLIISRDSAAVELGRFAEVEASHTSLRNQLRAAGDIGNLGLADLVLANCFAGQGRMRAAADVLDEGIEILLQLRHHAQARWSLMAQSVYSAQGGDVDRARRARQRIDELGPHPAAIFESWTGRADAWLAYLDHHVAQARSISVDTVRLALARNDPSTAVVCAHDLVHFGDPQTAAALLDDIVTPEAGPLYAVMVDHAHAAAAGDATGLADVANRFAEMDAHLWASQAAAAAAAAYSRAGDRRASAQMALLAENQAAQCEVSTVTANLVVHGGSVPLTRREREVAQLAAAGLSSREIGERAFLSVRTVDNHLGRVYDKLHVRNRAELAEVLAAT